MARQQSAGRSSARRYSEVEKAQAVRGLRAELGTDHGRSGESRTSWVSASSRCASGSARPTSTTVMRRAPRRRTGGGSGSWSRRTASWPRERDLEIGVGFLRGGARPPTGVMVSFIDENREDFGVEPIARSCRSPRPPTTAPRADPPRRGRAATPHWFPNSWRCGRRTTGSTGRTSSGAPPGGRVDVGRDQVARLMRLAGIEGIRRRRVRTTRPDSGAVRPADLVERVRDGAQQVVGH